MLTSLTLLFLIPIYEMKAVVVCIPLFLMLTFGSDASPAAGTDNQVKLLMRRYEGSGANLKRPAHSRNARDDGTDLGTRSVQGAAL